MRSTYTPPKKPARLEPDCAWVTVAEVHRSDGHGPHERTWCIESIGYGSTERAALDAAREWFDDTDQSEECEVTFWVERADGMIVSHRIRVGMKLVARRVSS